MGNRSGLDGGKGTLGTPSFGYTDEDPSNHFSDSKNLEELDLVSMEDLVNNKNQKSVFKVTSPKKSKLNLEEKRVSFHLAVQPPNYQTPGPSPKSAPQISE